MPSLWTWLTGSIMVIRWEFIFGCLYPLFLGYYVGHYLRRQR